MGFFASVTVVATIVCDCGSLGSDVEENTLDKSGWHLYNGAGPQSFALDFWRRIEYTKQKPLRLVTEGLLNIYRYKCIWMFLTLAGLLRESPPPDPKL